MRNEDEKPSKGILQTGTKPNQSKTRRISWGEVKIKEFAKHDEVNSKSGDEYNIALSQFVIKEEKKESESFIMDDSQVQETSNRKEDLKTVTSFPQNFESSNYSSRQLEESKNGKSNSNLVPIPTQTDKIYNYFGLNFNVNTDSNQNSVNSSNIGTIINTNNSKISTNNLNMNNLENVVAVIKAEKSQNGKRDLQNSITNINNNGSSHNLLNNAKNNFINLNYNKQPPIEHSSGLIKNIQTTIIDDRNNDYIQNTNKNNLASSSAPLNLASNANMSSIQNNKSFSSNYQNIFLKENYKNNIFNPTFEIEDPDDKAEPINKNFNRITLQGVGELFDVNMKVSQGNSNKNITNNNSNESFPIVQNTINSIANYSNIINSQTQQDSNTIQPIRKIIKEDNNLNEIPLKKETEHNKNDNSSKNNFSLNNNNMNAKADVNFKKLSKKIFESDEKSSSNEDKGSLANRMTLNLGDNLKIQLMGNKDSTDSDIEENLNVQNKRFTINLKDTLKLLYDDNDEDDLNNSLELRIENRRESNISASPINIKTQKLFYETCLSSASRCIETTEAKHNVILPVKKDEVNKQLQFETRKDPVNTVKTNVDFQTNESQEDTPKFENENNTNKTKQRITITEIFHDSDKKSNEIFVKSPVQIKNPVININTIMSPIISNMGLLKINQDNNDVDKRLNDLMTALTESNKNKLKNISEMEKFVNDLTAKLNEFNEEQVKIKHKKQNIKENIERLDRESITLQENKMLAAFPLKYFGMKVLSSEFNTFKIQILNRININFEFKEFSDEFLKNNLAKGEIINLKLEKIKFEIIKANPNLPEKVIDDLTWYNLIRSIYQDIYEKVFHPCSEFSIDAFKEKLKLLIKNSASFLYFIEIFSTICTVGLEINLRYIKENMSSIIQFSMFNRLGYKVVFLFEFEICSAFYGVNYRDSTIINISLSENNFMKTRLKAISFVEEIKKFLNYKEKLKNPHFFKEFLFKLNENILNL